jgi:uncharacterized protein YndB with AHSA1/START domain
MTTVSRTFAAAPDDVFAELSEGHRYSEWVVGAKSIRDADTDWPAVGARIHHTIGFGPIKVEDITKVLEVDPPRRLRLEARALPLGRAHVEFTIEPADGGCRVDMTEVVMHVPPFVNTLLAPLTKLRNTEVLRRLERLVAGGVPADER